MLQVQGGRAVATPVRLGERGVVGGEPWVEIVGRPGRGRAGAARAAPALVRDGTPVRARPAALPAPALSAPPAASRLRALSRPCGSPASRSATRCWPRWSCWRSSCSALFSYQRLAVDQFPNIDFPTVVVVMDYPGASPEIVESEVTKKVEEAVNTVAGISTLYSRSYEGTSVVIVEFNLDVDGRKAADDVREKVALIRPLLRDEVKEPRDLALRPAERADLQRRGAVRPTASAAPQELTTWATQVLQKRLENVRGVGSVSVVGGVARADQPLPQAGRARGARHRRRPGRRRGAQREPGAAARRDPLARAGARGADQRAPEAARGLPRHRRRARRGGQPVRLWQVADVVDGPQEVESLALYNGQRTVLLSVQKSQGENTIEVVDGLYKALDGAEAADAAGRQGRGQPRQLALDPRLGRERQAHAVRRRGADRS